MAGQDHTELTRAMSIGYIDIKEMIANAMYLDASLRVLHPQSRCDILVGCHEAKLTLTAPS
jgi:hypothetical protein